MLVVFIGVVFKSRDSRRLLTDVSPLRGWVEEHEWRCAYRLLDVLRPYGAESGTKIVFCAVPLSFPLKNGFFCFAVGFYYH